MAFTVDDFHDLIRLLEQHPDWRAELRRLLLTEELLELPALVRRLAEAQARTEEELGRLAAAVADLSRVTISLQEDVAVLKEDVGVLKEDVAVLKEDVSVLKEDVAVLKEDVGVLKKDMETVKADVGVLKQDMETVKADVGVLKQDMQTVKTDVGGLKGDAFERRYRDNAPAYFGRVVRRPRVMNRSALADVLDDAVERGDLTEDEREAVLLADVVATGRRVEDRAEVYVLAEVSAGVGPGDVERAADRAVVLAKLGRPVIPVVAGDFVTPEAATLAVERGVWQLYDGHVTPPDASPADTL